MLGPPSGLRIAAWARSPVTVTMTRFGSLAMAVNDSGSESVTASP